MGVPEGPLWRCLGGVIVKMRVEGASCGLDSATEPSVSVESGAAHRRSLADGVGAFVSRRGTKGA